MAEIEIYSALLKTAKSVDEINKIRDEAMVDKDISKHEFVGLVKAVGARKNVVRNGK